MQPTTKRLCLYSEYSNYKTCFYTCKAAEKNKIIFYPTTQNPSILRSSRNTNYTLHNTSNLKLYLKTSNVPFLKSCTETEFSILGGFQTQTDKDPRNLVLSSELALFWGDWTRGLLRSFPAWIVPTISHMVCMLIVVNPVFSACDNN